MQNFTVCKQFGLVRIRNADDTSEGGHRSPAPAPQEQVSSTRPGTGEGSRGEAPYAERTREVPARNRRAEGDKRTTPAAEHSRTQTGTRAHS